MCRLEFGIIDDYPVPLAFAKVFSLLDAPTSNATHMILQFHVFTLVE